MNHYFDNNPSCFVSSGTSALYLALRSLDIKSEDEIIVPAMSWISTAYVVTELGAIPVFAEIKNDLTICPFSIKNKITKKTKAIIAVHFGGVPCEMDRIMEIARLNNLYVIEDVSQAFGNTYNGQKLGTIGDIGCFSLNPMKIFGALGEAGLVIAKNNELMNKLKKSIYCGMDGKAFFQSGLNHRGDSLQARFLTILFDEFFGLSDLLKEKFQVYARSLNSNIVLVGREVNHIPYCVNILISRRDNLAVELSEMNVETKTIHYPLMCDVSIYKNHKSNQNMSLSRSRNLAEKILTLPFHKHLDDSSIEYIANIVNRFSK